METKDIVLLAVTLVILGEVTYLLAKLPKTSIKTKSRAILVDTSVLMDGRITSIAATGFIGGTLVVPRSVIGELQFLADNADADKRARARKGLDIVSELQQMSRVEVELLQDGSKAEEGVDERLLTLAKRHHATICTLDFNLNKVAVVEGIEVLNINDLAQALRMAHLPGDELSLELVQKGQDNHQGVGYLPDGTMVVVEQANALIGQTVRVEVVRSLQTSAGKMMFARRVEVKPAKHSTARTPRAIEKQISGGRKPAPAPKETKKEAETAPSSQQKPHAHERTAPSRSHHGHRRIDNKPGSAAAGSSSSRRLAGRPEKRRVDREAALIELVDRQQ